jgi:hypothetical protein
MRSRSASISTLVRRSKGKIRIAPDPLFSLPTLTASLDAMSLANDCYSAVNDRATQISSWH